MYEIMIQGPVQALIQVHTGRGFTHICQIKEHLVARISALELFFVCGYFKYVGSF